jgi:hypothetical protein
MPKIKPETDSIYANDPILGIKGFYCMDVPSIGDRRASCVQRSRRHSVDHCSGSEGGKFLRCGRFPVYRMHITQYCHGGGQVVQATGVTNWPHNRPLSTDSALPHLRLYGVTAAI